LPPAQTGSSDPHQFGPTDFPWGSMTWGGAAWDNNSAPGSSGSGSWGMGGMQSFPWGGMRHRHMHCDDDSNCSQAAGDTSTSAGLGMPPMLGGPTGSPWPWWAGMPLSQISAMTGGTWPWAFG